MNPCQHGVSGFCLKCADAEVWAQVEAGKFKKKDKKLIHPPERIRARQGRPKET